MPVPVYIAKVAHGETERRWKAMDDEKASVVYFDMQGTVAVTVIRREGNVSCHP